MGSSRRVYVRFTDHDPAGGWKRGEIAEDLGDESPGVPVRLLRKINGELLGLHAPYERGLIEKVGRLLR